MDRLVDTLDATDLRAELDVATQAALDRLDELVNAVDSGDLDYATGVSVAAKTAARRVKHARNLIRAGAAS